MANGINPGDGRYELTSDQTYGPPPTPPKPYTGTLTVNGSTASGGHLGAFTYVDPPGIFDHVDMQYAIKILSWDPVTETGTFIATAGTTSYTGTISAAP